MTEQPMRRLSDKLAAAFDQACEQKDVAVAELLHRALELVLTRQTGADKIEKRLDADMVRDAYARLDALRRAASR